MMRELLYGKPVIENPQLLTIEFRTWKERLFTFKPWSPFVSTKYNPDTNIYQGVEAFFMHPVTAKRLRDEGLLIVECEWRCHMDFGIKLRPNASLGVFNNVTV